MAIATATKIFGPSIWASIADKLGNQRDIIKLGSLLALMSLILLIWAETYWYVALCLGLNGLFWAAILPQIEVLTLNSIRRSAKIYGRIRLWGSIGFIMLAVGGSEIIAQTTSESFLWLAIGITFLLWLSSYFLSQPKVVLHTNNTVDSMRAKLFTRTFVVFFIAGVFLQIGFGPFYVFFALYLRDLSYSGLAIGSYVALGVIAEIFVFLYAGKLLALASLRTTLIACFVLTTFRWFLLAFVAEHPLWLGVSQILHAASFGLYHCASIQFIQRYFTSSQQSRGQAVYIGGVYGFGGAIGAWLAGLFWLNGDGSTTTFTVAIAATLLGAMLLIFMPKNLDKAC